MPLYCWLVRRLSATFVVWKNAPDVRGQWEKYRYSVENGGQNAPYIEGQQEKYAFNWGQWE